MIKTYLNCGFDSVTRGQTTIDLGGKAFDLCHFPRWKARTEASRPSYYPESVADWHDSRWLLHGHTHGRVQVDPNKKAIDVGVDAWCFRPVAGRILLEIALGLEDLYSEHDYSQPVSGNAYTITG
jgi:calcineurin-like phosphoesterase family protein